MKPDERQPCTLLVWIPRLGHAAAWMHCCCTVCRLAVQTQQQQEDSATHSFLQQAHLALQCWEMPRGGIQRNAAHNCARSLGPELGGVANRGAEQCRALRCSLVGCCVVRQCKAQWVRMLCGFVRYCVAQYRTGRSNCDVLCCAVHHACAQTRCPHAICSCVMQGCVNPI